RRLFGMASGPNSEIPIGLGKTQLVEEDIGHLTVVVLARVDQHRLRPEIQQSTDHWGRLHEVGSRADDVKGLTGHQARLEATMIVVDTMSEPDRHSRWGRHADCNTRRGPSRLRLRALRRCLAA